MRPPPRQRFDSTMAEATHVLGAMHLKSGRLAQACDCLYEALNLATLCEGSASLLTAEILEDLALAHLRKRFGIVTQEPVLLPGSVADNIRYGRPSATQSEVEEAARAADYSRFEPRFALGREAWPARPPSDFCHGPGRILRS